MVFIHAEYLAKKEVGGNKTGLAPSPKEPIA